MYIIVSKAGTISIAKSIYSGKGDKLVIVILAYKGYGNHKSPHKHTGEAPMHYHHIPRFSQRSRANSKSCTTFKRIKIIQLGKCNINLTKTFKNKTFS